MVESQWSKLPNGTNKSTHGLICVLCTKTIYVSLFHIPKRKKQKKFYDFPHRTEEFFFLDMIRKYFLKKQLMFICAIKTKMKVECGNFDQ